MYRSHPSVCEVLSHCGFNLHFLMNNGVEYLFMCPLGVRIPSLEKYLFKCLSNFNWIVCLLLICKLFIYSYYKCFITYMIYKHFLLSYGFYFHFSYGALWSTKVSNFDQVQLIQFSFVACAFSVIFDPSYLIQNHADLYLLYSSHVFIFLVLIFRYWFIWGLFLYITWSRIPASLFCTWYSVS